MTLRRIAAFSLTAFALAAMGGCGKQRSVEAENESVESVAKKVADADIRLQPGRWESTMTMQSMEMPNLPPEAQKAMQAQKGMSHTFSHCLTPEEAAAPRAGFFQKQASGCTYDHFTMAGGKIDAEMSCKDGSGPGKMKMQGTYSSDAYTMAIQSEGEMQPGQPMKVAMNIASRRTGECTGKEDAGNED